MSQPQNRNPLIKDDCASTIDAISQYIEWLCIQKAQDAEAHPGEVLQLEVLREAVGVLKAV